MFVLIELIHSHKLNKNTSLAPSNKHSYSYYNKHSYSYYNNKFLFKQ